MPLGSTLAVDSVRARRTALPRRLCILRMQEVLAHRQSGMARLSPIQRRLVQLIARGLNDQECAVKLNLAIGTVKAYNTTIYTVLRLEGRYELGAWWMSEKVKAILVEHGASLPLEVVNKLSDLAAWLNKREEFPERMLE